MINDGVLMQEVYIVQHLREDCDGYDDVKFIGVYSTHKEAINAVARLKLRPGFSNNPQGFHVQRYKLNEDHWTEGFVDASKP